MCHMPGEGVGERLRICVGDIQLFDSGGFVVEKPGEKARLGSSCEKKTGLRLLQFQNKNYIPHVIVPLSTTNLRKQLLKDVPQVFTYICALTIAVVLPDSQQRFESRIH